jgi:hypothetical protein
MKVTFGLLYKKMNDAVEQRVDIVTSPSNDVTRLVSYQSRLSRRTHVTGMVDRAHHTALYLKYLGHNCNNTSFSVSKAHEEFAPEKFPCNS